MTKLEELEATMGAAYSAYVNAPDTYEAYEADKALIEAYLAAWLAYKKALRKHEENSK